MLHYSFTGHIWPRCETLREYGMKSFDLVDALSTTDQEFCKKFDVSMDKLQEVKSRKRQLEEKDRLWVYSDGTRK